MKYKSKLIIVFTALILIALASAGYADRWPMFRQSNVRTGVDDTSVSGKFRPRPTWVFPVRELAIDPIDNVDFYSILLPDAPYIEVSPDWTLPLLGSYTAYGTDYLYTQTQSPAALEAPKWAQWTVPFASLRAKDKRAGYRLYVHIPTVSEDELNDFPGAVRTRRANYHISLNGSLLSTVTIDQRDSGWTQLGSLIQVQEGDVLTVRVTNVIDPIEEDGYGNLIPTTIVVDALRLEQESGRVIASPVVSTQNHVAITSVTEDAFQSLNAGGASRQLGVIYGIGTQVDSGIAGTADDRGIPKWRFPDPDYNWIEGGISSTPAIVSDGISPWGTEIALIPAGDGQIYAVETETGQWRWQGPGRMLWDPTLFETGDRVWVTGPNAGYQRDPRPTGTDTYYHVQAVKDDGITSKSTAIWTETLSLETNQSFVIYAWIPPSSAAHRYIPDARYTVELNGVKVAEQVVNQSDGGRWARLGGNFQVNVPIGETTMGATFKVSLDNLTSYVDNAGNVRIESFVAADAIKIVSADLGSFEFSSPAVRQDDILDPGGWVVRQAVSAYIGSTSGRVFRFEVGEPDPIWMYPRHGQQPVGAVYASPALVGNTVYVGTAEGRVYAIDTVGGMATGMYPEETDPSGIPRNLAQISSTTAIGQHLYVGTGGWGSNNMGYNTEGRVYAINLATNADAWVYPSIADTSVGAFVYASPLAMNVDAEEHVAIPSTDGYMYILRSTGTLRHQADIGNTVYSSPAGMMAGFPALGSATPRLADAAMAFVGSAGSRFSSVDLSAGAKDWWWDVMGDVISSPAICEGRIYVGDMGGFTWAFSTLSSDPLDPYGTEGDPEGWNPETGMNEPPTPGSDGEDTADRVSRQAVPNVDVFTREQYRELLDKFEASRAAPDSLSDAVSAAGIVGKTRNPGDVFRHEWGEDIYIIVWGLLDPNRSDKNPDNHKRPLDDTAGGFTPAMPSGHRVEITIKSREPGRNADSTENVSLTGTQLRYFVNADVDPEQDPADPDANLWACWYAAYVYTLDGSSSSRPQTPGATLTISARERPVSPDRSSDDVYVVDSDGVEPQIFGINNPLGVTYQELYGNSNQARLIGVEAGNTTRRELPEAQFNGNTTIPMVWGGITAHNRTSEARTLSVYDRSLLGMHQGPSGTATRSINRFRLERHSLRWTGDPAEHVVNPIGVWEMPPQDSRTNRPNISPDYPDISQRNLACLMRTGEDPTQSRISLTPAQLTGGTIPLPGTPWTVLPNGIDVTMAVPRFQPANLPRNFMGVPTTTDLSASGYRGYAFAYVDSNNNGVFDKPAGLGMGSIGSSARRAEAYRLFDSQVHVPVDFRAEIREQNINLGEVPHGFGHTSGAGGVPIVFSDTVAYDSATDRLTPMGFSPWFRNFTAENVGNTNMYDVRIYRSEDKPLEKWKWNLRGDTVQYPFVDYSSGSFMLGSGHWLPFDCLVSTLDTGLPLYNNYAVRGTEFMSAVPTVDPTLTVRTFHKPRVGEGPTTLRVPDIPLRFADMFSNLLPVGTRLPAFSLLIPLGQPTGTYYGRFQLGAMGWDGNIAPVSNTLDIAVTTTEARLTDGFTLGPAGPHVPHVDDGVQFEAGDGMPTAYRDLTTGHLSLIWASSRYGPATTGSTATAPTASDPWYLYRSVLESDYPSAAPGLWRLSTSQPTQWWSPALPDRAFPPPASVETYFPAPAGGEKLGAPGDLLKGSVKFGNPSVAQDKVTGDSWLFFTGEGQKYDGSAGADRRTSLESRSFYTRIVDGMPDPTQIRCNYPDASSNIRGEWTTPKYGIRGEVLRRVSRPELWAFWHGGASDRWRIYYNATPNAGSPALWTTEAQLPLPQGLSSAADPSPVTRWWNGSTGSGFDLVYSGYSPFHRNSDVYMSRYRPADGPASGSQGNHWPVALELMPQRSTEIYEIVIGGRPLLGEKLVWNADREVWSAQDVDWNARIVSAKDGMPNFQVYVCEDPGTPGSRFYQLNIGSWTKDASTGAIVFQYTDSDPDCVTLREKYRSVLINPVDGTVKFLKPPKSNAVVAAAYKPKAYRLTTDAAADVSPCAFVDDDRNPRWSSGHPAGNPFYGGSNPPPTDRLWLFWRRAGSDRTGAGSSFKTYRYMVQLKHQIGIDATNGQPYVTDVSSTLGAPITSPVEIDWVKNRLYFTRTDAVVMQGGEPVLNRVIVRYDDKFGSSREEEIGIRFAEEDMGPAGKTLLSSLMVNEGDVHAFKDPGENKVWVFWTSTRSGNPDLYYQTISPLFYGVTR